MLKTGALFADRYEVVGKIGSGGMADVYKAKDHKLNRFVAVKVMKAEFNNDDSFVRKFRREAQAAAGLANPNIVNVFDVGEDHGLYYIVMELVEGITLKEYVAKKQKLSVREATSIAIQVCMGLSAAHAQGIVHRDIKPQNIIISTDGKVKVTDFGIARAASSNTISANAMGSVHYSSPEQVRGGYSDAKSDIYSLGITMYEMVTGRVPFDGETTVAIAIKHLQDEMDPPSKYTPDLPYSLEQIIYKCTQKSPDRRYNSVNEVIADLRHSLTDPDGRFVQLLPVSDNTQTVMISPSEMSAIKNGAAGRVRKEDSGPLRYEPEPEEEEPPSFEDDDEGGISSRLEKAMTIGGFIIGAAIICVLIYFIGRAAGLFHFGGNAENETPAQPQQTETAEETPENEQVETPTLLGLTREQAQTSVTGLAIGIKYAGEEASEEYPAGQICRQDPEPHTMVSRNSTILFYVSSGKEQIAVPPVIGLTEEEARTRLTEAGFLSISATSEFSDTIAIGDVMAVSPDEGVLTDPETQVVLTVSNGPEGIAEETVMLNWRGVDEATATNALEIRGFRVAIEYGYTNALGIGTVMDQSVEEGETVRKGSTIVLTINSEDMAGTDADVTIQHDEEPSDGESAENGGTTAPEYWVTNVRLDTTSEYKGGAYRLTLVQNVNGQQQETTVAEGNYLTFPFDFSYDKGVAGEATGDVYLYEESNGSYIRKAKWTVPFQTP